jgi:hypothetical protein
MKFWHVFLIVALLMSGVFTLLVPYSTMRVAAVAAVLVGLFLTWALTRQVRIAGAPLLAVLGVIAVLWTVRSMIILGTLPVTRDLGVSYQMAEEFGGVIEPYYSSLLALSYLLALPLANGAWRGTWAQIGRYRPC